MVQIQPGACLSGKYSAPLKCEGKQNMTADKAMAREAVGKCGRLAPFHRYPDDQAGVGSEWPS